MLNASLQVTRLSVAAATSLILMGVYAADDRSAANPEAAYQKQRAVCLSGQSNQDRDTCLKEAGAALAEAKRGNLTDGKGQLDQNRLDRCNALAGSERTDCVARMQGAGVKQGSVAGGGILRETVTVEPASAASAASAATK